MSFDSNLWNRVRYTLWAPIYDLVASPMRRLRRRAVALADIRPGERVLLVGAGTGLDLDFLPREATVTATDLTPAMLARLRQRAARLGLSVDTRVMDGHALEFPDASFDVVLLHFIVAVIPDPARCAREAARVLRSGGRAVILDKFAPDEGRTPLFLRLLNPLASLIATNVNRRLGPILAGSGLRIIREEPLALRGLFKVALARKD